ncbi:MAG: M16 family metallopeptidase, partial [Bacteroidota bacterium]
FHTELEAVYEEKNMSLDRDDDKVWETLFGELFKKHNYGLQTTIGTVEHLKNPSLEAIRQYYNTYYVAGNMAIVMSGDFNPDSVAADVWKNFAGMRTGDVPTYVYEYEDLRNVERAFDVVGPKSEYLTIGYRFPGAGSKESKAAQMISWLLSNNSTGLIDKNLVINQMVLSAIYGVEQMNDYGVFLLMGEPQEGQTLDSVKTLLLQQMEKVRRGDFDEGLLKSIVLNKDIDQIKSFKENRARASFLMQAFVSGKTYRDAYNELYEMSLLTKEDLIDFANEYLNADRVVVYKRKGEKAASAKIDKPTITAVELNRDKRSDFVSKWLEIPAKPVVATVVDLEKEIKKVALNKGASELR